MTEQSFRPAHMRADGTPIHTAKIHTSKIHTASCFRTWDSASWMAWATCVAFSMYTTWPISGDSIYTIVRSINCNILESWANLGLSCTTIYITLGQSHATYDRGLNSGTFFNSNNLAMLKFLSVGPNKKEREKKNISRDVKVNGRMSNSTQAGNAYTVQSTVLHKLLSNAAEPDIPPYLKILLWTIAFLEPIAAILYVASAIPAIRKEGFWFLKSETNGMIRPNNSLLIPIFVLLYMIFSLSSLICLLIDLHSTAIISARTTCLSLLAYPILLCTGWTKIWNILRAIPLTKYGLATMRQKIGDSSLKFFAPRTLNFLSAFLYAFPLLFGAVPIGLITKEVWRINQTFTQYSQNYASIISGKIDIESIASLNVMAVEQLISMLHRSDKVLFLARVISFGYFLNGVALLFIMVFGYYRLLEAVGYQVDTFQKAFKQRAPIASCARTLKSSHKLESTPFPNGDGSTRSDSIQTHVKGRHQLRWLTISFTSWLPSFRPDPQFPEKPDPTSPINQGPKLDEQQWESANQEAIDSQFKSLKRYKVNLIWQAFFNGLILLSFLGLTVTVFGNLLQVPNLHSLSDLIWVTITWASASWVLTVGLPFGLVACVVAFSPPITTLRENEERVVEFDD
ncbi:hypothetical protein PCASD_20574 [Puccinia coronata f. sp. avenae]|uniref:Uncharacterized protein n=1 Tax=Puccinia coronata f. sp. avenae TaxID=200324 RepID=A0A2N5RX05_9BASI|nr:hypothetical protein PCASD_23831 [Puccinia coronata f. sp. avenae]PLW30599.1 hypothetical protein PCASD_20574 [Puccinia coronata f. sp. avenae]